MFSAYPSGVKNLATTLRPGALVVASIAAWPLLAISTVKTAGVDGCVRAHGIIGFVATHGAMMRPVPTCTTTQVGHPEALDSVLAVVAIAATIVLFTNLIVTGVAAYALTWVRRAAAAIGRALPDIQSGVQLPAFRVVPQHEPEMWRPAFLKHMPWRRGPPRWVPAAG